MPRLEEMFGQPDGQYGPGYKSPIIVTCLINGTEYDINGDGLVTRVGGAIIQVPMPLKKELVFTK